MAITLNDSRVAETLDRMYSESQEQMSTLRERRPNLSSASTVQERADVMSEFYIPVTPESGRLLYSLVRATRPATVVEFGMSFGISALHLASAIRDNDTHSPRSQMPVIKLLEPKLSPGALVVADNTESADTRSYLDYVHDSENGYASFNFAVRDSDSMELSCYAGS